MSCATGSTWRQRVGLGHWRSPIASLLLSVERATDGSGELPLRRNSDLRDAASVGPNFRSEVGWLAGCAVNRFQHVANLDLLRAFKHALAEIQDAESSHVPRNKCWTAQGHRLNDNGGQLVDTTVNGGAFIAPSRTRNIMRERREQKFHRQQFTEQVASLKRVSFYRCYPSGER